MRVNDPNLSAAQLNTTTGAGNTTNTGKTAQLDALKITTAGPNGTDKAAGARTDSVNLSTLSSKINELQSGSPEREAYLEALSAQYAAGQYQEDPAVTSAKLVEEALAPNPEASPKSDSTK